MELIREYLIQNWSVILILLAFAVMLKVTVFLDQKIIKKMYILVVALFAFSMIVFFEYYLEEQNVLPDVRIVLMMIRYSTTPFIIAMVLFTLIKKANVYYFVPAIVCAIINFISIPTGIVCSLGENGQLIRGPLGYLPYIAVGGYCVALIWILYIHSNKLITELIPMIFLSVAFISGVALPLIIGVDYFKIFCSTIVIAIFVYYVFLILQITNKDTLTGLMNRQAYYTAIDVNRKDITALVSIDMNGLKVINDTEGHAAGDEALSTIAFCFLKAAKSKQSVYRVGGDEFVIICLKSSEEEVKQLIERINKYVSETKYHCAIGYSYIGDSGREIEEVLKESDAMMYENKADYYAKKNGDRNGCS